MADDLGQVDLTDLDTFAHGFPHGRDRRSSSRKDRPTATSAHLARLEIRVALDEVLATIESFSLAGPPEWTRSNRHAGIRHLPLLLTKARA
jgi:hypothetical protein